MATYEHPAFAKASWQGNYFAYGPAHENGVELLPIEVEFGADELSAADIHRAIRLNSDCIVLGAFVDAEDLDSNGTPTLTFDLGYSGDTASDDDYWLANSTIAQAGGVAESSALPFIPTEDYFVQFKVETGAATGAAGKITLYLRIANGGAYAGS